MSTDRFVRFEPGDVPSSETKLIARYWKGQIDAD
jgi:hypothetical protein